MREKLHATHTGGGAPARNRRRLRKTKQKKCCFDGAEWNRRADCCVQMISTTLQGVSHTRPYVGEVEELSVEESLKIKYVERCMRNAVFAFFIRTNFAFGENNKKRERRTEEEKDFVFLLHHHLVANSPLIQLQSSHRKHFSRFFFPRDEQK